jgi:hypothetical protein
MMLEALAGITQQQGAGGEEFPTTDLFARYEAKDETGYTDGDFLATVVDQHGTHDLAQATALQQPSWDAAVLNGRAVYGFNRADNFAEVAVTSTEVRSVALLASSGVGEATSRCWPFTANDNGSGTGGTARILAVTEGSTSGEWGSFVRSNSSTVQNVSSGVDTTVFCLLVVTWDESDARLYRNGTEIDSDALGGSSLVASNISMGRLPVISGQTFLGDVALAAVWTSTLDATAIATLSSYCQSVYAVG